MKKKELNFKMIICLLFIMIFNNFLYAQTVKQYVTYGDQSMLLEQLPETPSFISETNSNVTLTFDETTTYQTIDGFGYTLTQGSAYVMITEISPEQRHEVLTELFDPSIGIAAGMGSAFLRIGIGATDLSQYAYTYNDLPPGETDEDQSEFSLAGPDLDYLIPVLQEILIINPDIKIVALPWTAPAWMKTNEALSDGHLKPEYYASYTLYFVKYLQAMQGHDIPIHFVAPQNEPLNCCNNPAMLMTAQEQIDFIMELGPAIQNAGFSTKILTWDHNCDVPEYPLEVFASPAAQYVDGAAWHLYGGDISAMSDVHDAYPEKTTYFTEQYTSSSGSFLVDLGWHMRNVMIGGTNNWAKAVLEWNIAADANVDPHTDGGCDNCLGAYTLDGGNITRNVAYYIVAQLSKFIRPGATRVASTSSDKLYCAAFINNSIHGETRVMVVYNDSRAPSVNFNIEYQGKIVSLTLPKKSVGTYIWNAGTGDTDPPTAPQNLIAAEGDGSVSLNWDDNSESDLAGYNIYRSATSGSGYSKINGSLVAVSEYTDNSVINGTTYYFVVTAVDYSGNESANSMEVSATPAGGGGDPTTMHIEDIIKITQNTGGGNKIGIATVTVYSDLGTAVSNATVTGTFSGDYNEIHSGVTGIDGTVTLETNSTKKGVISFDFCVDDITHATLTYDPLSNVITCTSEKSGIEMISDNNLDPYSIKIFPNPVVGNKMLTVVFNGEVQNGAVRIMDIIGNTVYKNIEISGYATEISVEDLPTGMYNLSVISEKGTFNLKLIVR
ncbi:MAG: T9SS type A sorting domain-containing protein [Bacteroidales bacterium]|nr:T9SS type A sorting domain-containing protein [Bacteroidales bacterium]